MNTNNNDKKTAGFDKKMTRKEAIKKTAGITALTAASLIFMQTNASAQTSQLPSSPGQGW